MKIGSNVKFFFIFYVLNTVEMSFCYQNKVFLTDKGQFLITESTQMAKIDGMNSSWAHYGGS